MNLVVEKEIVAIDPRMFYSRKNNVQGRHPRMVKCKITENDCWEVISHKPKRGGYVSLANKYLHRLMFLAWYPYLKIPNGIEVNHTCDNRACINPFHLHLGTQADNMQDMINRGRSFNKKGEDHPNARLTAEQVQEIRADKKLKHRDIAKKYGISKHYVSKIKTYRCWKYLLTKEVSL